MLAALMLLGLGFGLVSLFDDSGDDSSGQTTRADDDGVVRTGNGDDFVVAQSYMGDVNGLIEQGVAQGDMSAEEANAFRNSIEVQSGTMNLNTQGGDDVVFGGSGDDTIKTGDGEDTVFSGAGDDFVQQGDDDDLYGFGTQDFDFIGGSKVTEQVESAGISNEATLESGNDTVIGAGGDDIIMDGYGSNDLRGWAGNDGIDALDQDGATPDTVSGGAGNDHLIVDSGDVVSGGTGQDRIEIAENGVAVKDYAFVEVTDYSKEDDIIEISGFAEDGETAADVAAKLSIEVFADNSGASILLDGTAIARVTGGQGLTVGDLRVTV